jgi:hypothetical protein
MLVEGLQEFLAADSGVSGVLGTPSTRGDSTTGIFPMMAVGTPTAPYLVYSQVSGEPQTDSFQGTNALQNARWRFSCHGSTYKQAKELAKYVSLALFSLYGSLPVGKSDVQGSWKRSEIDTAEPVEHGTIFTTNVDFEFIFIDGDVI